MPSHLEVLHAFEDQLVALAPEQPPTRMRMLADLALGMAMAGEVTPQRVAAELALPTVQAASTERRCRRWLANPGVEPAAQWDGVRAALLRGWTARQVTLVYDPTPLGKHWQVLMVSVVWGGRARPLAWEVAPLQVSWETPLREILDRLFRSVHDALPPRAQVTLLLDRGLIGPAPLDAAQAVGWDVVLRLRAGPRDSLWVRTADGREARIGEAAATPGRRPVAILKQAEWRQGWLTVWREPGEAEPLVLFSTRRGGADRVREYRRRMTVEATYADLKRRGLHLERTRMRSAAGLERLLMGVCLAIWWLYDLGAAALRQGFQPTVDRRSRRDLALFRIGGYWLRHLLDAKSAVPLLFARGRRGWRLRDPVHGSGPPQPQGHR